LKTGQSAFWRKGDKIVQGWMDEQLVQMKSTIRDATVLNAGKKERKDLERNLTFLFQCNKFMKGVDKADKYLSYYSDLRKTVK
jgi:hypothetical protein